MSLVTQEALTHVEASAHGIDVNASAVGIDEERMLPLVQQTATEGMDVPIYLETSNLEVVLSFAKEHGFAVIGLCIDERMQSFPFNNCIQRREFASILAD